MANSSGEQSNAGSLLIADRFEVHLNEPLGVGGLSTVYRALDRDTGILVAAKRLNDEFRNQPEAVQRFRREGRITSVADHFNIVGMVNFDLDPHWMFLELLEGLDLKQYLAQHGPIPLESAVLWTSQVASALDRIHAIGVVHLDLKPQNLFLTNTGDLKVIDFGVAQEFSRQQDRVGEDLFGTAAYLAPEQPGNRPVNARTDVYALGCVFYELITGRTPYVAEGLTGDDEQRALVRAHAEDDVTPPSEARPDLALPTWVDDVVDRSLAKNPQHRFASAGDMARAARRGIGLQEPEVTRTTIPQVERRQRPLQRNAVLLPQHVDPGPLPDASLVTKIPRHFSRPRLPTWVQQSSRYRRYRKRTFVLVTILTMIVGLNFLGSSGQLTDVMLFAAPAITTEVTTDGLNLRQQPSTSAVVVQALPADTEVTVTGAPTRADDLLWWPVAVEFGETTASGWVWSEGIATTGWMNTVTTGETWTSTAGNIFEWFGDRLS